MSKSTRMTPEQLRLMNLEEVEPGVYKKKKTKIDKAVELVDTINIATAKLQNMFDGNKTARHELDEQGIIPSGTKGRFEWGNDGKSVFVPDKDGQWEIVNRPNDAPPLYQIAGIDPASDEPSHSAVVKRWADGTVESVHIDGLPRPDLIEEMQKVSKYYITKEFPEESIRVTVKGEPTPQQRHRHHQVKGSDFVTTYDPSSKAKKEFLKQCFPYRPEKPYEQPLRVDMVFYFSRPKSHYRSGKYAHLLKDNAPEYHTSRNDADNCAKFVMDALNKTFWKDDALISMMSVIKKYDDNPRTEITITPI